MRQRYLSHSLLERITDCLLVEQQHVKRLCEGYDGSVINLLLLMNADDMLGPSLEEYLTNELRVA